MEQLCTWFTHIDWAATGSMVGGLSTLVVAVLTLALVKENRLLRNAGSSPKVVAHFELHADGNGGLNMALSNVGTGPAFDVSFSFEKDDNDFKNYGIIADYAQTRPAMTMIAQGEKISFLFAITYQLFKPKDPNISEQLKPFKVNVSWRTSGSSKMVSDTYVLDVAAYAGLPGMMNKPPLLKIADELAAIKKQIGNYSDITTKLFDATMPEQSMRAVVKGAGEEQN